MGDLLCHPLRTHTVVLQKQLDATHKPGVKKHEVSVENALKPATWKFITHAFHSLCIAEQVEAERVGWWEDVI